MKCKNNASRSIHKNHHLGVLLIIVVILAGIITIWYQKSTTVIKDVPQEATEFLTSFLETCKNDPEEAVSYCHFEDDFERQAYEKSNIRLVSYEVLEACALSDDLCVFKLHLTKEFTDIPERYYFVGSIDGKLYLMNNIYNIPQSIRIGLDNEVLTRYSDSGLVFSSDVLK